jgi:hypothetical protein
VVTTEGATIPQLLSSFRSDPPKVKGQKRKVKKPAYTMEVIKGGKVVKKQFKQ